MTLSRAGDSVPCAFHDSRAPAQHRAGLQCQVAGIECALLRRPCHRFPLWCSVRASSRHCGVRPQEVSIMLHLIAVGRLRDGPEAELFARYNARLRPSLHCDGNCGGARRTGRGEAARRSSAARGVARMRRLSSRSIPAATHPTARNLRGKLERLAGEQDDQCASSSAAPKGSTRLCLRVPITCCRLDG